MWALQGALCRSALIYGLLMLQVQASVPIAKVDLPVRPDRGGVIDVRDFHSKMMRDSVIRKRQAVMPNSSIPSELFSPVSAATEQPLLLRTIPVGGITPAPTNAASNPSNGRIKEHTSASAHRNEQRPAPAPKSNTEQQQHISLTAEQLANIVKYLQQASSQDDGEAGKSRTSRTREPARDTAETRNPSSTSSTPRTYNEAQKAFLRSPSANDPNFASQREFILSKLAEHTDPSPPSFGSPRSATGTQDFPFPTNTFTRSDFPYRPGPMPFGPSSAGHTSSFGREPFRPRDRPVFSPFDGDDSEDVTVFRSHSSQSSFNSDFGPPSGFSRTFEYDSRNGGRTFETNF